MTIEIDRGKHQKIKTTTHLNQVMSRIQKLLFPNKVDLPFKVINRIGVCQGTFEGDLIEADKKTFRQKKAYWTKIDSVGTDLWIYFSKIADHQQHAESELIGLSLAVLGNLIPQVGEVIGVSQLLLSDKKVEPISMLLAKSSYHSTLAHLPIYWSTRQKKLPTRIKLLDKKTVSVMLMNVEDKGVEFRILNGAEVSTKHYILSSKGTAPLNIWLAVNKDNIPYFFQLKGGDDDSLFTISLKP